MGQTIEVFTSETVTKSVSVNDATGNPVDLSGETLWFGIFDRARTLQDSRTPTGTATGFNVTMTTKPEAANGWQWVCRKDPSGEGVDCGHFLIKWKPTNPN